MEPEITELKEQNGTLMFKISDIDVSFVNAIRRTLQSNINIIVFKTYPHKKNKCEIEQNTSRMNNEVIKHRLSCIPIHIEDVEDFEYDDYEVELDVENTGQEVRMVTTKDFKMKNIKNNTYVDDISKIFPPDKITNQYIDILRLRPKISENIPGELIKLKCKLSIGNHGEDAAYNVASTCHFINEPDEDEISKQWPIYENKKQIEFKEHNGVKMDDDAMEFIKMDWYNLNAKRYYKKNCFIFYLETVGIFDNKTLLYKACIHLIKTFVDFTKDLKQTDDMIVKRADRTSGTYEINLKNQDIYTTGLVLRYVLMDMYYNDKVIDYCTCVEPNSLIISFSKDNISNEYIKSCLTDVSAKCIEIFKSLSSKFKI